MNHPDDNLNMNVNGLLVWPASTCLVTELIKQLGRLDRQTLSHTTIIVPTTRITTLILAQLAAKFKALTPPRIMTIERFIIEEFEPIATQQFKVLNPLQTQLILSHLIDEGNFRHIRKGHEHEISQLFNELTSEHLLNKGISQLRQALDEDIFRSQQQLDALNLRLEELDTLLCSFDRYLTKHNCFTKAGYLKHAASQLMKSWRKRNDCFQSPVYLLGFTSLVETILPIVRYLGEQPKTQIWLSEPPRLLARVNPLKELIQKLDLPTFYRKARAQNKPTEQKRYCYIHKTTNRLEEIECALDLAEQLCKEYKIPPSQIGILVTNEANYGKPLRAALAERQINANVAIPMKLGDTILGSWLSCLIRFVQHNNETPALIHWLCHPLTLEWLKPQLDATITSQEILKAQLVEEITQAKLGSGLRALSQKTLPSVLSQALELSTAILNGVLGPSSKKRPLKDWCHELQMLCKSFFPEDLKDRLEAGVYMATQNVISEFSALLGQQELLGRKKMNRNGFFQLMSQHLLCEDVRAVGEPLLGYQVLGLPEARYYPFQVVLILGCLEGSFPKSLPKDELLDDLLKRRMGLSGWAGLEAREDLTFNLFKARLANLHLFYSTLYLDEPTVRSRYIEQMLAADEAMLVNHPPFKESGVRQSKTHLFNCEIEGQIQFDRSSLFSELSASSLEALIKCPYQFLLKRIALKETELPSPETDAKKEGDWLHTVVELFMKNWASSSSPRYPQEIVSELSRLSQKLAPQTLGQNSLFLHLNNFAWPRFAEFLCKLTHHFGETAFSQSTAELRFNHATQISVGPKRVKVQLRGAIDRVDCFGDVILVTDYKRKHIPAKRDVITGLNPQLPFYAYVLSLADRSELTPSAKLALGYWSLLDGTWQSVGAGEQAAQTLAPLAVISSREPKLDDLLATVKQHWQWRMESLFINHEPFYADPSACDFCAFANLCRKNDPTIKSRIERQDRLQARLYGAQNAR